MRFFQASGQVTLSHVLPLNHPMLFISHLVPFPLWSFWVLGIKGQWHWNLNSHSPPTFLFPIFLYGSRPCTFRYPGPVCSTDRSSAPSQIWPFIYPSPVSRIMVATCWCPKKYLWHGWLKWFAEAAPRSEHPHRQVNKWQVTLSLSKWPLERIPTTMITSHQGIIL